MRAWVRLIPKPFSLQVGSTAHNERQTRVHAIIECFQESDRFEGKDGPMHCANSANRRQRRESRGPSGTQRVVCAQSSESWEH